MTNFDFTSTLESCAVITTILQFLSGLPTCQQYVKRKSTGESSGFPFLCGFLSCALWLRYGISTNQTIIIYVNMIGAFLMLGYSFVFYTFTVIKKTFVKQFFGVVIVLVISIIATNSDVPQINVQILGYICCLVTVCFFAAPFTMLLHVIRTKNSESLPLPLIAASFVVSLEWLIYGVLMNDIFIQVPNFVGVVLSLTQLSLFVCYPPKTYTGIGYKLVDDNIY